MRRVPNLARMQAVVNGPKAPPRHEGALCVDVDDPLGAQARVGRHLITTYYTVRYAACMHSPVLHMLQ